MEWSFNQEPRRDNSIVVDDLRKDLFAEFSKISRDSVTPEKEHLQVFLRVRPFTASERAEGESKDCISIEPPDTVFLKAPPASLTARHSERFGQQLAQRFQFSQVYGPETTQKEIFDGTTKTLVKQVLEGGNSLIFTYGVTNAGKTFTFLGPESDGGILPRSLNGIFNSICGRIYMQNSIKPYRCTDFIRLTKEQQDEEITNKKNLLRRFKDSDSQKFHSSTSSSSSSSFDISSSSDMEVDSVWLDGSSHVKFSVWISFCEIYNENIHDLLELVPNGSHRRTVLKLAQDVKGNSFVKDLKWFHVNSADEAMKFLKIGRKNQSFSSTKLNSISSRSHSIFSIRILRIEDVGVPRVQAISELSLCDLAGSERCAKTQNKGERLKESGNINTSLLTLGKCINALRLNQTQSKFQQHIPFRESKLTHYLQGFFCGRGKACMIININQCASVYDETLNVLKFSAVAQKVVVLNPKPAPSAVLKRSAREVSMMINNADNKDWARRSSVMGWEMSLEDVQEDEDDEEELETDDDASLENNTVLEASDVEELQELQVKIDELKEKLLNQESTKLTMETQIREEVSAEFMELFSSMKQDYNERLQKATEIVEERSERRLEILKNLVNKNIMEIKNVYSDECEEKEAILDSMIQTMRDDLARIKGDAESVQMCLADGPDSPGTIKLLQTQLEEKLRQTQQLLSCKTQEHEAMCVQMQQSSFQLVDANKNFESEKVKCHELMSICQEKDDMVSKLQTAINEKVEENSKNTILINHLKQEILNFKSNCKCSLNGDNTPRKAGSETQESLELQQELKRKDEQLNKLKVEHSSLQKDVCDLSDRLATQMRVHKAAVSREQANVNQITTESKALTNELLLVQQAADEMSSKLRDVQMELNSVTTQSKELSEKLLAGNTESHRKSTIIQSLRTEIGRLRQDLVAHQVSLKESEVELKRLSEASQEKSKQLNDLELEVGHLKAKICQQEEFCVQLRSERDAQTQEHKDLLRCYEDAKHATTQIRRSELAEELLRLGDHEQDSQVDCWKSLQDKLMQMLNKLVQHEEALKVTRTFVEKEVLKARDETERRACEMKKVLGLKDAKIEIQVQELLRLKESENEALIKIKEQSCSLQQVESLRSYLADNFQEAKVQNEQLLNKILILNEEKKTLQERLRRGELMKDQAIDRLQTTQPGHSNEEHQRLSQTLSKNLLTKPEPFEKISVSLSEKSKLEEESLKARLHESQSKFTDLTKVLETSSGDEQAEITQPPGLTFPVVKESKQLEEAAIGKEERSVSKASRQEGGHQDSTLDLSVFSTSSFSETLFLKPDMETITPMKPDKINVCKAGQEESSTVELRRSARKRKNLQKENSDSQHPRKRQLRVYNKENFSYFENPEEQRKVSAFKREDYPASPMAERNGALQKIAKTVRSTVKNMSPELQVSVEHNKPKKSKRKLYKTNISSPLDIPSNPMFGGGEDQDKGNDHLIIKRKLRTRIVK